MQVTGAWQLSLSSSKKKNKCDVCAVHGGYSTMEDIMGTSGEYHEYIEGYPKFRYNCCMSFHHNGFKGI